MTPQEFQYLKRAIEALDSAETTHVTQIKILRTMGQICSKNATVLEHKLFDQIEDRLYNTHIATKEQI
jgi:hypothetical protein